jgi:hypothetical protein
MLLLRALYMDAGFKLSGPIFCREKRKLIAKFTSATSDFLRMQTAQTLAIKNGDTPCFGEQVEAARRHLEAVKQAIFAHQQRHPCEQ